MQYYWGDEPKYMSDTPKESPTHRKARQHLRFHAIFALIAQILILIGLLLLARGCG